MTMPLVISSRVREGSYYHTESEAEWSGAIHTMERSVHYG